MRRQNLLQIKSKKKVTWKSLISIAHIHVGSFNGMRPEEESSAEETVIEKGLRHLLISAHFTCPLENL
jgi:hypothetical protein